MATNEGYRFEMSLWDQITQEMHSWRQTKNLVRNLKHGEIQIKQKNVKMQTQNFIMKGEISIKKIDESMSKSKKSSM